MEQKKVYHVVLTEEQIVALGNLNVTLLENECTMKTIPDALDESSDTPQNLWEGIQYLLPALSDLMCQLPM